MKKLMMALTLVLVVALGVNAQDVAEKKLNFYLGAGAGLPMGDFGDFYKLGLHGAGALGYSVTPDLQIRGKVEFHTFGIDEDAWKSMFVDPLDPDAEIEAVEGGSLNAIMFGADGRYSFPMENSSFSPFILGGLGMAALSAGDFDVTVAGETVSVDGGDGTTEFYFEVGAGADIAAGETMSIFIQGRYVSIQTEGSSSSFIPFTVGVKF